MAASMYPFYSPMSDGTPTFMSNFGKPSETPPMGNYIQQHGLITPLASPVKSNYPEAIQSHPQILTPPLDSPASIPSAPLAGNEHKKKTTKTERQTTISEHLKSSKKGTGAPRGRPRKYPRPEDIKANKESTADAKQKAAMMQRLDTLGFVASFPLVEAVLAVPNALAMETEDFCKMVDETQALLQKDSRVKLSTATTSDRKRVHKKKDSTGSPDKKIKTAVAQKPVLPPSPPASPKQLPSREVSPFLNISSPVIPAITMCVDKFGQASIQASFEESDCSSLPSLSTGSTASTSNDSLQSFAASFVPANISSSHRRKMTKADVPGMGRVIFEHSVLVSRMGEEAAQKAIESAEASTFRRSNLFDAPGFFIPRAPPSISSELIDRSDLINGWLQEGWDAEEAEDLRAGSFFQPMVFPFDPQDEFGLDQEEEETIIAQGGKSLRTLKRRKLNFPVEVELRTPSPSALNHLSTPQAPKQPARQTKKRAKAQDGKVACICNKKGDDDDNGMVQCDACRSWFHLECLKKDIEDFPENEDWFCPRCTISSTMSTTNPLPYHHHQISTSKTSLLREPIFVESSPNLNTHGPDRLDVHLFSGLEAFPTPGETPYSRKRPWSTMHTPSLPRHPSAEFSFSPKTPAVGFMRGPRARLEPMIHPGDDHYYTNFSYPVPEDKVGLPTWDHYLQTPSRSAGLASDWSLPLSMGTPNFRRKSSYGSVAQEFFQGLQTPRQKPQQHVSFDMSLAEEMSPLQRKPAHRRNASVPYHGSPIAPSALKMQSLQPPALVRTSSGLGIGFGAESSGVRLDDLIM